VQPDGTLLVSVDVEDSPDKGVVHNVLMERLRPAANGGCQLEVAEPVEWRHFGVWEDWWAKIRITRHESVNGGPWRQTHDSGWQDWASGSRRLAGDTMRPDSIGLTAWGSMGANRALGGPRNVGAIFNVDVRSTEIPSRTRLVVHVTRPGNDPVDTVPFELFPTQGAGKAILYQSTSGR